MALKKTMEKALNEQLHREFSSAHLYLSMSAWFESRTFPGLAHWMYVQMQEEQSHQMKFFRYINERGGKVTLAGVESPRSTWENPLDVFTEALKHEEMITECINDLVDLSVSERDHATNQFLQWYISEQVEEEAQVTEIVEQLRRVQNSADGLYLLEKELGARIFVDATQENTAN